MSSTEGEDKMKNMTDTVTHENLQKELDAVKNDISALTDKISDVLNTLTGKAQSQARRGFKQARSNVDALVSDFSDRSSAAIGAAQEAATTIEETLEDAIQKRPLATVGLAIGLGFLIGVTWRR